jgi:hypothetical protein
MIAQTEGDTTMSSTSTSTGYPATFPADGPVTAAIKARSGDVTVTATDDGDVVVDLSPSSPGDEEALDLIARATVAFRHGNLRIGIPEPARRALGRDPGVDVDVRLPSGSTIRAETGSGDIVLVGVMHDVDLRTGSGDVRVDRAAATKARTGSGDVVLAQADTASVHCGSGDIEIVAVRGDVEAESASGDVRVGGFGAEARVTTASGDVHVDDLAGRLQAKTASGDVRVARAQGGEIQARTASGDISVAIVVGTAARLDCSSLTGQVTSELEATDAPADTDRTLLVSAQSVSGSVRLTRTS